MIKKIDLNSYKYFENIIKIKQVIDYCESNNPELARELRREGDAQWKLL